MPDLPTGTVTFLFTDIEGSTRLLGRLGARYREVQDRHDTILREAIAAGEGREIGTEGDSFFAVFRSAGGALATAARAQRELAGASWPEDVTVRARMGVHTGEGILGGDNYLGLDVNRAARISAAGHGGQVLLSDATRALADRSLPARTHLRDLGQHRLKDLPDPEHLHQLVIEGLEQEFPPPKTLDARPNNLPPQLTRFIGRREEIERIRELIATHRLVTMTGPGGTGKTRLGLEVGANLLPETPDGVFFVDLSAVDYHELVAQRIAAVLGVHEEPGRGLVETLGDHLRDKDLLLVLDNFEHVVDAGTSVLEPLLRATPRLNVLVTSRVPLHLYGEQEFKVPPLALPDPADVADLEALAQFEAVALFTERAAAGKPGFRITAKNARPVAAITARLDGLPLAIELAASRLKLLSPDTLLSKLDQRLPLLRAQERNVPERQRTLRQTIEWSYDLLDQAEQRMFTRLSVFSGGADLEAVETVVNPESELEIDTLDGLASLVDKNLLRTVETPDGGSRFAMLETIHEFGLEQLSKSDEEPAVRKRHIEHCISIGEGAAVGLFGAGQASSIRRLELDYDNFRSALNWALRAGEGVLGMRLAAALREFWRLGGHLAEGRQWLDELLALPSAGGTTPVRARALTARADVSSWMGQTDGYLRFAEEAVSLYRELGDSHGIPDAVEELGAAQMFLEQFDAARASFEEAKELNIRVGNRQKAAECTFALGVLALVSGHSERAREPLEEAFAAFTELRDPWWTAFSGYQLGLIDKIDGDHEAAQSRYRTGLDTFRRLDSRLAIGWVLYAFADLAVAREQPERAMRVIGASDAIRKREGELQSFGELLMGNVREAASASLDESAADRLYREGLEMELDQAVAYALKEDER